MTKTNASKSRRRAANLSAKPLKVCHYTAYNGSGMAAVARSLVEAEKQLGLDSHLVNIQETTPGEWDRYADADIHVSHTHFPDQMRKKLTKPLKLVWVSHGTPEHVFNSAVEDSEKGYGHSDGFMLFQFWMRSADARVTFWPRHAALMETMTHKGVGIHCFDLGVNLKFWGGGASLGKYAGNPSVWSGENCHAIKYPLDLFLMWPLVYPQLDGASLHVSYLPTNQHRYFFPLVNANGASYASHISPICWPHDQLRNIFKSVDFFIGLVKYGDHNRLSLEANAAGGCKTISYAGNEYSDFWLPEGDQRIAAAELVKILQGEVKARKKKPVADVSETAQNMIKVYESIL